MTTWVPELCDKLPKQFEKVSENKYIQRKDICHVVYHSLDGTESFEGYECYKREITYLEYLQVLSKKRQIFLDD